MNKLIKKGKSMGLSAGQARLLTITGRKSDCEFESMRISHQKIALTRQLADLSNEYQNSLEQTKLIYDFYGTGDTSTQLSYGLLMSPSALNNYMPTLITDSLGRVTLNTKLAAAARAAGIPQEGLGSLPSDAMRNSFIEGLAKSGVITDDMANKIVSLPYNQNIGFGGGTTVAITTDSGNFDELCDYLNQINATVEFKLTSDMVNGTDAYISLGGGGKGDGTINAGSSNSLGGTYNLGDMLSGKTALGIFMYSKKGKDPNQEMFLAVQSVVENILDQVGDALSGVLDLGDGFTAKALEYAQTKVKEIYTPVDNDGNYYADVSTNGSGMFNGNVGAGNAANYIGWAGEHYKTGWGNNKAKAHVSLYNMLNAYLTFFADYVNGISQTDVFGKQVFDVHQGQLAKSTLASNNKTFQYTWKTGTDVSSDDLGQAAFYDALFNQICANGWTENKQIEDNGYLQEMLQSGRLYVSRTKDDGYYYQGNYATDSYIKEVADETLIAQAEAKYNTEKAKLNQKEETLDLKMKNLDTEISSLTTEYDTVKNTISKNIEKSFKRYNA